MINHYLRTVSVLFFLLVMSLMVNSQVITPFNSIYTTHQKGGVVFLSNAALGCSQNPPASTGTCLAGSMELPLVGATRNDDFPAVYIDVDGDATTFMSSSDSLNLPVCSKITKAFLFWGASGTATTGLNQIKLKLNNGTYQTVVATSSMVNTTGINSYHCYADVTSLIINSGAKVRVSIADIPSSQIGSFNAFGSWNLVVVYGNETMAMRQLNVFNGLAHLSTTSPLINVPLSGFLTPTLGAVNFEIGVYTHEGDKAITGDNILFNGNSGFLPLVDLTANPLGDVMNNTVSNNGIINLFRKPLMGNTMGSDADIYAPLNLLNVSLANSVNTATVQFATITDDYLVQALTSSIDSYETDLRVTVKARDVNGGSLNPGETLRYRLTGYNIGSDVSGNTFIVDTLDANLTYVPNSTSIVFGPNSGSKTDAAGDDQVDYNAATRILKIRIGVGANSSSGGIVDNSFTGIDSTVVTYSVTVPQSCLKLSCDNSVKARAYITGTGAALSHTVTHRGSPGTNDLAGCEIQGSTTTTVSILTCATFTATNSSPACSGGTLTLNATSDPEAVYSWSGPGTYTATGAVQTLTALTITMSGNYTATLAIPLSTCMVVTSTSVTINACVPTAANDFTNTVLNTSVSGNAGTNDVNSAPNGTFSILAQPANGTLSINSITGAYSFTPATGFIGVTTATYQLCRGIPVVCSQASITFSVYANLVANADNIFTTPLTTTTGSLLANDGGITSSAVYSVSVSPLLPTVGVLTINSSTGQYTFIPNALFTGTAQTTYTVCNTSVNPDQCSSATITINVSNAPVAIDDFTATVINIPVNGNAGVNDSGTLGGTFTFGNVATGTGTLTGGSITGLYVFTPAANFTGTTSATYTLCNLLSPICSTATITFTVYPLIQANPDVVVTTPSVTVTGSLLTNDAGITAGANYSISITQPLPTTGTLQINSSTGEYTFIPNSAFTGTTQTTYTVCNISVSPMQCSSTTITLGAGVPPVSVDDHTYTVANGTVTGNVSLNDSNTLTGIYTFGNAPSGTLTTNSSTGQYTFMPQAGFTGSLSVTYTLCTIFSPPCATAVLVFTVFPALVANPDLVNSAINTSVTGNFISNDSGILGGQTYSMSLTPISASVGVISVNASSGQYTFVPATGFTGSAVTTYTLIQYNGTVQIQTSVTTITISVSKGGSLVGISKKLTGVSYNTSGTFNLTYKLIVKNYSNFLLTSVSVEDDLSKTFPSPATYTIIGVPSLVNASGSQLSLNTNYSGSGALTSPATSSLASGRTDTIQFEVKVDPQRTQFTCINNASISAVANGSVVTDNSVDGMDPDPDQDFDPGNNASPTVFNFTNVNIGIAKYSGSSTSIGNGCYQATFKFTVKNYGANTIYNIQVIDNLSNAFGSTNYSVLSTPVSVNGYLQPDPAYNGSSNFNLVTSSSQLSSGQTDTLLLDVKYCTSSFGSFTNTAVAYGNSAPGGGFIGYDISVSGLNPDLNNNNNPADQGEDLATVFYPSENFEIPQGFSPNGDGINDKFEIKGRHLYPEMEVTILNRWGNIVYSKKQYDNTWDGKSTEGIQYGGNDLPEGTYFYIVDLGNDQKPVKGYIYLNRTVK